MPCVSVCFVKWLTIMTKGNIYNAFLLPKTEAKRHFLFFVSKKGSRRIPEETEESYLENIRFSRAFQSTRLPSASSMP